MTVTLFFIALKLGGLLAWVLLFVFSPLWLPPAVALVFAALLFSLAALINRIAEACDE